MLVVWHHHPRINMRRMSLMTLFRATLELARKLQEAAVGKITLTKWDVVDHLQTDEDMALYLEACLEEGDPVLIVAALGDIARAAWRNWRATPASAGKDFTRRCLPKVTRNSPP